MNWPCPVWDNESPASFETDSASAATHQERESDGGSANMHRTTQTRLKLYCT